MKKHIAEELPARKHAPAAAPAAGDRDGAKGGKDEKSPEKRKCVVIEKQSTIASQRELMNLWDFLQKKALKTKQ